MAKKTLYVSDQDEGVWGQAEHVAGAESLSRFVTESIRLRLDSATDGATSEPEEDVQVAVGRSEHSALVNSCRALLRKHGWEKLALAYSRALIQEGAARSRAKRKADVSLGPEGRQAAARKRSETMGPEGRKRAARAAWVTRKRNG
jgi:hypothetical protein